MERNTKLALGVIAITAIGGAIALPAFADGGQRGHQSALTMERGHAGAMTGGNDMMQMTQKMARMRGNMMGAQMQGQARGDTTAGGQAGMQSGDQNGMMAGVMAGVMNGAGNGSMMKND